MTVCYHCLYMDGSSPILNLVEPYGQKMNVMLLPVHDAGLEGGSLAEPLLVDQVIGHPVAVIVLGGCWESKIGLGRSAT